MTSLRQCHRPHEVRHLAGREGRAHVVVIGGEGETEQHLALHQPEHEGVLAGVLRHAGVLADALDLKRLPHDVVLSERLLARVGHDFGDAVQP
jgi:hypothetical protein